MNRMTQQDEQIRRVAVLVDSVDSQTAGQILSQLSNQEAESVRSVVVDLGKISRNERTEVLQQFLFAVHGVQDSCQPKPETKDRSAEMDAAKLNQQADLCPTCFAQHDCECSPRSVRVISPDEINAAKRMMIQQQNR